MKNYFSPIHLLFFIALLGILVILIQVELLSFAFVKLGLPPDFGLMILFLSLLGSAVNLPVTRIKNSATGQSSTQPVYRGLLRIPVQPIHNETQIFINLGGCLIPVTLSIYLFSNSALSLSSTLLGIAIISSVSYVFSRPIQGLGIGMPILIAPICAALVGLSISPEQSAPLAYISGTLGVLIGADLLRMKDIYRLGTPFASIGGAGTFDGIFITGIVAALLA
ncbi:DUF1614 domain-containing protein [Nitrosomonas supralitoralis]|uniref:DUF1614 domain-containing protein n=1 Tax=Nitrosomonas supralitoralis TaxID=2116706 RepID=A0A2P7NW98_9PROT|nr:DUF1614 domain-containing protein [Nitrosomonas supralitoralis]PSJ17754.1 hypothetical protein C7H79_06385 [Nitrosomonas supralitoralis]